MDNDACADSQTELVEGEEHDHNITSKINLVDLAGSERSNAAQTSGERLRVQTYIHACNMNIRICFSNF